MSVAVGGRWLSVDTAKLNERSACKTIHWIESVGRTRRRSNPGEPTAVPSVTDTRFSSSCFWRWSGLADGGSTADQTALRSSPAGM